MAKRTAFTLVELLVVIAIVAIMIAWLLSALRLAREQARLAGCLSNARQISLAINNYAFDADGFYPVPPLGKYINSTYGFDYAYAYMPYLYGGDDIGVWGVTPIVPAEERPMAGYLNPYSHVYRCPADIDGSWHGDLPAWDAGTTSYLYNAEPYVDYPGLYELRLEDVPQPSLMIEVGDQAWWTTRTNLPDNDFANFTFIAKRWWHPLGFAQRRVSIAFVDGHADFVSIEMRVPNTDHYRRDP